MDIYKPVICLDFDGVLHSYVSPWVSAEIIPDPPVPGALDAVEIYLDAGFRVMVFSSRSDSKEGRKAMSDWCYRNGFPIEAMGFPSVKPPAIMTIDDRGFCFQGTFPDAEFIRNFKPWNRR